MRKIILATLLFGLAFGGADAQTLFPLTPSTGGGSVTVPTTTLTKTTAPNTFSQVTAIDGIPFGQVTPAPVAATTLSATGTTTTAGINDSAGINTTAASAYSISGTTVFNQGIAGNGPTLIGPGAGAALTAGTADTGGGYFAGWMAGNTTHTGAEATFIGNQAGRYADFVNSGNTFVGDGVGWHETTGNNLACYSADSCRNEAQNTFSVAYGRRSFEDWFGTFDQSALGNYALKGNAAAIFVTGTPRTGDAIPIIFTDPNLAGGATTVTYTVLSSDTTNSILSASIATAIANASIAGTLADNISADNDQVRNPGVVGVTHSGNSTIAGGNSGTMAVTIGTITPSSPTEVLTVTNGATGSSNTMTGAFAGQCLGCSTANGNNGTGSAALTYMTTAQFNNCDGIGSCAVTTGHDNNVMGSNALINIVSGVSLTAGASDNELIGSKCGTTLVNDTGVHGDENIEIGDCQTGGGYITTGAANLEIGLSAKVPTITANFQMSIQNAIYGVSNSGTGTTVSTGCIGFYFTTCSSAGNGFAVDDALNLRVQTSFVLGSGSFPNMVAGEMGWVKQTAPAAGPGIISVANEIYTCGAAAGTLRKIAFGGTSNVPNVIIDNIGGGNTGCTANNPTITAGTATLDASANDLGGLVTEAAAQTGFTLTWTGGVTKNTTPHCVLSSPSGLVLTSYTVSTTALTVVNASTGGTMAYVCGP